jgi:hypothetical protein
MLSGNYKEASASFDKFSGNDTLKKICDSLDNCKYSVSFARGISYILPGSGQIYAGHYFAASMSLAWNALWIYVSAGLFSADKVLEGILTTDLLWLRFYNGNVENAGKFARENNAELHDNLLEYLQNNFKGIKP